METKKNLSLIFALCGISGFLLLCLSEGFLHDAIRTGMMFLPTYARHELQQKILAFGMEPALALLAQLKFRWIFLCLFAWWLYQFSGVSKQPDQNRLRWRVRLFFVVQLLYIPELLTELNIRWRWGAFFEAPLLPGLFLNEMPPIMLLQFGGLLLFGISAWLVLARWENGSITPFLLAMLVWCIWTILLSIYQSAGVTDHAWASLHSGMLFMVIFLFLWWKFPETTDLGHRLFQAGIWGCYFFSGAEKIFLSGVKWIYPEHLAAICLHHPGEFCSWFTSQPLLTGLCLSGVLAFQLLSPLQWKFPRWAYVTAAAGLLFHLGTWLVLDVGSWQSPWILMLIFLLPVKEENKTRANLAATITEKTGLSVKRPAQKLKKR